MRSPRRRSPRRLRSEEPHPREGERCRASVMLHRLQQAQREAGAWLEGQSKRGGEGREGKARQGEVGNRAPAEAARRRARGARSGGHGVNYVGETTAPPMQMERRRLAPPLYPRARRVGTATPRATETPLHGRLASMQGRQHMQREIERDKTGVICYL